MPRSSKAPRRASRARSASPYETRSPLARTDEASRLAVITMPVVVITTMAAAPAANHHPKVTGSRAQTGSGSNSLNA